MIEQGDCLDLLKKIPNDSVDAIVTDPPYGLSFMKKSWDTFTENMKEFFAPIWNECLRVLKPGAFAFVMSSPRQNVMTEQIIALKEAGFEIGFTSLYWTYSSGFPKGLNISKAIDRKLGYYREVLGIDEKFLKKNPISNHKSDYGGFGDGLNAAKITIPSSHQAKQLDGSYAGFQPKPAVEVILVAMKPLSEKTYAEQALKNGKGVTWLHDGRIPYKNEDDMESARFGSQIIFDNKSTEHNFIKNVLSSEEGRFPSNLLVSDDALNDRRITKGSFSRYFDLDIWYEKNVESLVDYVQRVFPFLIVPKPSNSEKNKELDSLPDDIRGYGNLIQYTVKNIHPTVKPIKLMSYLITIASRKGDIILDPFMGSGTTGVACKILNRKFIGFEKDRKYFEVAEKRIENNPKSEYFDGEWW